MSKADRFRAKQKAAGLVQANEWVPSNQRELFRAVAKALREEVQVTIGTVASDRKPEQKAGPGVTSNPEPEQKPDKEVPSNQQQAKPKTDNKVASDRQKKAEARKAELHAQRDALFNAVAV